MHFSITFINNERKKWLTQCGNEHDNEASEHWNAVPDPVLEKEKIEETIIIEKAN